MRRSCRNTGTAERNGCHPERENGAPGSAEGTGAETGTAHAGMEREIGTGAPGMPALPEEKRRQHGCGMKAEKEYREDETAENRHKKETKAIKIFLHFLTELL